MINQNPYGQMPGMANQPQNTGIGVNAAEQKIAESNYINNY